LLLVDVIVPKFEAEISALDAPNWGVEDTKQVGTEAEVQRFFDVDEPRESQVELRNGGSAEGVAAEVAKASVSRPSWD
jgi:hypothetical protein